MISVWNLYWIMRLDCIREMCTIISTIGCFLGLVGTIALCSLCSEGNAPKRIVKQILIPWWIITFTVVVSVMLLPTTKQMAALLVLPQIINNERVKQIPNRILDLADEWLNELSSKNDSK